MKKEEFEKEFNRLSMNGKNIVFIQIPNAVIKVKRYEYCLPRGHIKVWNIKNEEMSVNLYLRKILFLY
jgi:hypothetical protein